MANNFLPSTFSSWYYFAFVFSRDVTILRVPLPLIVYSQKQRIKVNATNNYWGDASGPYQPSVNPEGKGNPVNGNGGDLGFIPFSSTSESPYPIQTPTPSAPSTSPGSNYGDVLTSSPSAPAPISSTPPTSNTQGPITPTPLTPSPNPQPAFFLPKEALYVIVDITAIAIIAGIGTAFVERNNNGKRLGKTKQMEI